MIDPTPPRRLVKIAEAHERHPALSPYILRALVRRGGVKGCRPPGTRLFLIDVADLDRVMAEARVGPTAPS